jgi:4-aminobutyrate aminotransferase-like enzyme
MRCALRGYSGATTHSKIGRHATRRRKDLHARCNGAGQNAIRLSPPLVLTTSQADTAIGILDQALAAVRL